MILLALSTSGRAASAALLEDGVPLAEATRDAGLTHSETILPLTCELLEAHGLAPSDIDVFAADVGPGSFTGVRIGVCAINAMAAAFAREAGLPARSSTRATAMLMRRHSMATPVRCSPPQ